MLRSKAVSLCASLLIALDLLAWSAAVAYRHAVAATAPSAAPAHMLAGTASYYGQHWQGRKTASGSRFDLRKLTAAHRSLPLNSRVRVTNLENAKSVTVLINDRGPYVDGRVIDLSTAAARRLGMVKEGLAPVRIAVLSSPSATKKAATSDRGPSKRQGAYVLPAMSGFGALAVLIASLGAAWRLRSRPRARDDARR